MGCNSSDQVVTPSTVKSEPKETRPELETVTGYKVIKDLGEGRSGKVFLCRNSQDGRLAAIKAIKKDATNTQGMDPKEEIKILSELDHPNVVKLLGSFESERYFYIVMEHCGGGDLFDNIVGKEKFIESEAKKILEGVLLGLSHCHQKGVIHRDVKPENVLMSEEGGVKLIDFGLSMKGTSPTGTNLVGTPFYIAPEILNSGRYSKAGDVWALGVLFHLLLTGYFPISGKSAEEVFLNVKMYEGPVYWGRKWVNVSQGAKDLLKKMLEPDPERRITAAEALKHSWFSQGKSLYSDYDKNMLSALKLFNETAKPTIMH